MAYINFILLNWTAYILFVITIGYYFITNLQWYSYKLNRVVMNHTKPWWHFIYFLLPFILYMVAVSIYLPVTIIVAILYMILLYSWYKKLDKPLVFTGRVKRFYTVLIFVSVFILIVFKYQSVILPLLLAYLISVFIEMLLFSGYKSKAEKKLDSMDKLIVVGITASYGKTSMKNYLEHILKDSYKTYATPRSVNTLGGIMKDINDDLPLDTQVYIVEMGARGSGDISEISTFVNPQYVVVGKIGPAHIEYFKTIEKIRNTKMEILQSDRLKTAWIHESAMVKPESNVHIFGELPEFDMRSNIPAPKYIITDIEATLESTNFSLDGVSYSASILGAFNAINLSAATLVAKELSVGDEKIQKALKGLKSVPHRLQRLDAGGKVILDDSFNGNIDGMMASFELSSTHKGRKVIITPGLVEVDDEYNIKVAQRANEVFDIVIVSGELNYDIFKEHIDADKLLKLSAKSEMESMLVEHTKAGDLILFANDAPSFI